MKFRRALRLPTSADRLQRELDQEIAFHMEERIRELTAAGMSHEEAREHALRRFGDAEDLRAYCQSIEVPHMRRTQLREWLASFAQDIRFAARQLARAPGFAVVAIVTLALGVGASTSIFSVVRGVLLRPLPFPDADRVVYLWQLDGDGQSAVSDPNFEDVRARTRALATTAQLGLTGDIVLSGSIEPLRTRGALVSRDFFSVMRVTPLRGRLFVEEEQQPSGRRAMLVSHGFWQRVLAGDESALGRSITLADQPYSVVGILPPGFDFPGDAEFWVPREIRERTPSRTSHNFQMVARLADGVTLEGARAEVSGIARALKREHGRDTWMEDSALVPVHEQIVGKARRTILVLMAGSLVLLLIACANVVNLLIARMAGRQTEMALRVALGAGRMRLVQQCLAESLMLAVGAAAIGLLFAWAGTRVLLLLQPENMPRLDDVRVDGLVLAFGVTLAAFAATGMGVMAAWRAGRGDLRAALAQSQRTQGGSLSSERARRALVVAQVAMAVVLLVAAGLFGRSFGRLLRVDMGFVLEQQVVVDLRSPVSVAPRIALYDQLLDRFRALPDVRAAGAINSLPLGRAWTPNGTFLIMRSLTEPTDDRALAELGKDTTRVGDAMFRVASQGYFETMGIPIVRGRAFEDRDVASAPHVAVISQSLAAKRWPNDDPIGKIIQFGNMDGNRTPFTIVGVVGDVRESSLASDPEPTFYATYRQRPNHAWWFHFVIATSDAVAVMNPARLIVRELSPDAAPRVRAMASIVSGSVADRRFVLTLAGVFGAAALLLAALGIYSVISYLVAQREREISIRIALGATSRDILGMVMRQGIVLTGSGIVLGAAIAVAATRTFESMLYGVRARDPLTFAGVIGLLALVALAASLVPALRAARAQPSDVMRG